MLQENLAAYLRDRVQAELLVSGGFSRWAFSDGLSLISNHSSIFCCTYKVDGLAVCMPARVQAVLLTLP